MPRRHTTSDIVIVGGGSAALAAAATALRRRASVTIVSSEPLGGDCTFRGCIPSKTLLTAAREGLDYQVAHRRVRQVIDRIALTENADVWRSRGVTVVEGRAHFDSPKRVATDDLFLEASAFIVATGSAPALPPIEGWKGPWTLTTDQLFDVTEIPARLLIVGAGPIGVEMAEAFSRLGSRVTLFEGASRILPREEPEASAVIHEFLISLGVTIETSITIRRVEHSAQARVHLDDGRVVEADYVLGATGRRPRSHALGVDAAGFVLAPSGAITVDSRQRTSVRGIYAAGDVAHAQQFTHVAYETGRIAATNALSPVPWLRFHPEWVSAVTYTALEVARVGVREVDLVGTNARVAYLPLHETDRAIVSGEERGFVKILAVPRPLSRHHLGGRIVGATIVAPRAGEMMAELSVAIRGHSSTPRLALTSRAYPTWSVAVQQAVAQLFGEFGGRTARPVASE
ncbi:MAG: NAD(P)/FAD-dependent oxidoreductase [Acidobacteria bacterium]|nr:NAD(P)/FAD-dependent oxidoreductase [Acidobacteriota bacterium]